MSVVVIHMTDAPPRALERIAPGAWLPAGRPRRTPPAPDRRRRGRAACACRLSRVAAAIVLERRAIRGTRIARYCAQRRCRAPFGGLAVAHEGLLSVVTTAGLARQVCSTSVGWLALSNQDLRSRSAGAAESGCPPTSDAADAAALRMPRRDTPYAAANGRNMMRVTDRCAADEGRITRSHRVQTNRRRGEPSEGA